MWMFAGIHVHVAAGVISVHSSIYLVAWFICMILFCVNIKYPYKIMLRNFYPTTRFCPIFCWFLRYLSPLKRSMLSKYFAINIYSFKLSIFGTALDIIMFKKCIFPPFFLHLLPMKKNLRYTNGGRQTQICRLLNRQIRHCQLH